MLVVVVRGPEIFAPVVTTGMHFVCACILAVALRPEMSNNQVFECDLEKGCFDILKHSRAVFIEFNSKCIIT